MLKRLRFAPLFFCIFATMSVNTARAQNNAPVVSNVTAAQRPDASKLVDIHYNLADADGDSCTVWISVSDNGGTSFRVVARTFTGDIGTGIPPGTNKTVVWDAGTDMPGRQGSNFKVRVWADDGNGPAPMVLVPEGWFPYQNTSNPQNWVFVDTFLIDKFEVTNAFYCQFLNNADPTAQHWVVNQEIDRWGDSGSYTYTVQPGKDQYPIRYVNYFDAEALATWRSTQTGQSFRLPSEHEWEKAAAWNPVLNSHSDFAYEQDHPNISCLWANCDVNGGFGSPYCYSSTTEVGHFNGTAGTNDAKSFYGGYDLTGNVNEWTASGSLRGGAVNIMGLLNYTPNCATTFSHGPGSLVTRGNYFGIRLVLDPNP